MEDGTLLRAIVGGLLVFLEGLPVGDDVGLDVVISIPPTSSTFFCCGR